MVVLTCRTRDNVSLLFLVTHGPLLCWGYEYGYGRIMLDKRPQASAHEKVSDCPSASIVGLCRLRGGVNRTGHLYKDQIVGPDSIPREVASLVAHSTVSGAERVDSSEVDINS